MTVLSRFCPPFLQLTPFNRSPSKSVSSIESDSDESAFKPNDGIAVEVPPTVVLALGGPSPTVEFAHTQDATNATRMTRDLKAYIVTCSWNALARTRFVCYFYRGTAGSRKPPAHRYCAAETRGQNT